VFVGILAAASLSAFLTLQVVTDGWFSFHMFATHSDRYSLIQFFALAALVWASAPATTALALWHVVNDFRANGRGFAPVYFLASTFTSLSAGQLGSTTNHFLEWMIASCMCAALGYHRLISKYPARAMQITVLLSVTIIAGVIAENRSSLQPTRELTDCASAYRQVRDSPSQQILSQSLGPLLIAEKPILISDTFIYVQLLQHGRWPDRRIERMINERSFGLIVMTEDPSRGSAIWPDSLLTAISRNYRAVSRYTCPDARVLLEPAGTSAATK
jgi:hypothetical protein